MRTTNRVLGVVAVSLLVSSLAVSAPDDPAQQGASQATQPAEPPRSKAAPPVRPAAQPSSTFIPSEKIKADSSVAFPVDI